MSEPKIVASAKEMKKAQPVDASQVWATLGWIGITFLVVGGADFALTWYPPNFASREWEFGTVTASFNGLPILVLGMGLLLAASVQIERRWWSALTALVSLVMLLWLIAGAVLWATNVPLALSSVPLELAQGVKKSIVKTAIQSVVYPVILILLLRRSIRAARGDVAAR